MDDEILIECVRKYPVIYDMTHSKYLDTNYKSSTWRIISEEMKQADENCKKRWANIRDQFKRTLKKRKTKSGQSAKIIKKYKYDDTLQFLVPHIEQRDTISNIENKSNTETDQAENDDNNILSVQPPTTLQPHHDVASTVPPLYDSASIFAPLSDSASFVSHYHNSASTARIVHRGSRNYNRSTKSHEPTQRQTESASHTLMKYIIESYEKVQKDIHPIEAFFNGLIPTIKQFSPYHQHIPKGRIFAVVQEVEWKHLSTSPPSNTCASLMRSETSSTPISHSPSAPTSPPTSTILTDSRQTARSSVTNFSHFMTNNN